LVVISLIRFSNFLPGVPVTMWTGHMSMETRNSVMAIT
jgi:hypothetical protein